MIPAVVLFLGGIFVSDVATQQSQTVQRQENAYKTYY